MEFKVTIEQIDDNHDIIKISSGWHKHMKKSYSEASKVLNNVRLALQGDE